jgi:oligopeptide/dipeptide ABC transporter ATP-binding protein
MPVMGATHLRVIPGRVPLPEHFDAGCRFRFRCPYAVASCDAPQALTLHHGTKLVRCHRRDELPLDGVGAVA